MTKKPKKTLNEMRAEIRGALKKIDEKAQADVRAHKAKKKPAPTRATRLVHLRHAEAEVKASKPLDPRCIFRDMKTV